MVEAGGKSSRLALLAHAKERHNGKKFRCNLCEDALFMQRTTLLQHQMRVHNIEPRGCKVYKCMVTPHCGYRLDGWFIEVQLFEVPYST